jgi:formylglycine-generating enzyme required for sulfatase activity
MSGNVAEWCLSDPGREDNCAVARGGSWAEKLEAVLRVDYPMRLPCAYRGADTGFRWIMEIGKTNLAGHVQSLD